MIQDQGDTSNPSFSKAGSTLGVPLSLDCSYATSGQTEWPVYASACIKQEPLSISCQDATMSMQTSTSSLLQHLPVYKSENTIDFSPVKQEPKGGGLAKHQPAPHSAYLPSALPPPPQPSPTQKLSLDKYREKHTADLAVSGQKPGLELHGGGMDCDLKADMSSSSSSSSSSYASSFLSQLDHRKYSQFHQTSHGGSTGTGDSQMKVKGPSLASQDKRHHSDKWDKGSLKLRMAGPGFGGSSQLDKSGQSNKEDLKMKIKVSSSDRHSSSDEGVVASNANNKSKHSSSALTKEKQHHNLHRHHKHSHLHSGNGRGEPEGLPRAPPGLATTEGPALVPPGSAPPLLMPRKRVYPEVSHNHHPSSSFTTPCSKVSKISKGGAGAPGTSLFLHQFHSSTHTNSCPDLPGLFLLFFSHTQVGCGRPSSTLLLNLLTKWGSRDTESFAPQEPESKTNPGL